jgi:hypothetical protein
MSEFIVTGIFSNCDYRVLYRPKPMRLFTWLRMAIKFQTGGTH